MSPGWNRGRGSQKWACPGPRLPRTGGAAAAGRGRVGLQGRRLAGLARGRKTGVTPLGIPLRVVCFSQEAELERLEREFAIQSQITEAARRLASDPNVSKKLKKQRKTSYLNALKKLQEIESAINENRVKSGKKPTQRASLIIEGQCQAHSPLWVPPSLHRPSEDWVFVQGMNRKPSPLSDLASCLTTLCLNFSIHKMKLERRDDTNQMIIVPLDGLLGERSSQSSPGAESGASPGSKVLRDLVTLPRSGRKGGWLRYPEASIPTALLCLQGLLSQCLS